MIKDHMECSVLGGGGGGADMHACMLMAATGVVPCNIGGLIHRALRLQVEHGSTACELRPT